jgi:hypothetical protein
VNRALRAATVGVLLFTPVALSACSAGQVNQTSTQVRDKVGLTAQVGDILLRGVQLAYPQSGAYAAGDDAPLQGAIVNTGAQDDVLTGISGPGFSGVRVTGSPSGTATGTASAIPTATATPTSAGTPTGTATPTPTGTATATSPSASTSTSAPSAGGSSTVNIPIPVDSSVFLGKNAPTITLVGLAQPLNAAQAIEVTFTFQRAGQVTVMTQVAAPSSEVPHTSAYNFEPETQASVPNNRAGSGNLPGAPSSSSHG